MKTLSMSFFYIYHKLTQGIWDDRFFAPFTTTLPVRCLMQLHTLVEKTLKPFFQTAPFNISEHFMLKVGLFFQYDVSMYVCMYTLDVAKHPLLGVVETSYQRIYS